jgi:hypothetical protein
MQKKSIQRINENRAKFWKPKKNPDSGANSQIPYINGKILKAKAIQRFQFMEYKVKRPTTNNIKINKL